MELRPAQAQLDATARRAAAKPSDVRVRGAELYFLPVKTRIPLKFGTETLTSVTCARARVSVADRRGNIGVGWGETPLSVQWVWPGSLGYAYRHNALKDFCEQLTAAWASFTSVGHPLEIGYDFQQQVLPELLGGFNRSCQANERMPNLAALLCCSPFDLALHDAYGNALSLPVYETYNGAYMNRDLGNYLEPAEGVSITFRGKFPADYLSAWRQDQLRVWHLVGGLDVLDREHGDGHLINDGEPQVLSDWIERDGIHCLKIKLRGDDADWDFQRILQVGAIAQGRGPYWLSADFNCTVTDPEYVNSVLDRIQHVSPRVYDSIWYVEQPFPYDLESHRIDVHSIASRKPLLMDESAHNWEYVRLGRTLGWNGVALKTCKTQTGALLMQAWAKAHGMHLMVQDLTNPMLAQIPHVLLAAYAGTMMGVESNSMQFYPDASIAEARVHPAVYRRRDGQLDLTSIRGPGFGYRIDEIDRHLGEPAASAGSFPL